MSRKLQFAVLGLHHPLGEFWGSNKVGQATNRMFCRWLVTSLQKDFVYLSAISYGITSHVVMVPFKDENQFKKV